MAGEIVLEIEGITGESATEGYAGYFDLLSWSWGGSHPASVTGGGLSGGGVNYQDCSFTTMMNKSTGALSKFMADGKHVATIKLVLNKATGAGVLEKYFAADFTECMLTSITTGGSEGSGLPMLMISFVYSKFKIEYFVQAPDGSLASGGEHEYDVKAKKST